jgi:hypothetical protein
MSRHFLRRPLWASAAAFFAVSAHAQNSISWTSLELYGNLETAGVTATISGDANRSASACLLWRRVGEPAYRNGQPLVRVDDTHFVGSLFNLKDNTNYEILSVLTDVDGVSNGGSRTAATSTRADVLVEPTLRTLYVSPSGDDTKDGLSLANAVKTVLHAANLAQAGDIVLVSPGIYREAVDVPHSGSAAQPIVFRGNGAGVVMDGSTVLPGNTAWTSAGSNAYMTHLAFDTAHVVDEQGRLFRYDDLASLQALAAGAPGGFWYDDATQNLFVKFSDASVPASHTFNVAKFSAAFALDGRSYVRIENFQMRYYGSDDYGKGVYLRYSNDCIVRSNRFLDLGSTGVWIKGGARDRIEDNDFSDTSIVGWPWPVTKGSPAENNAIVLTDDVGRGNIVRRNHTDGGFNGIGPCGSSAPADGLTTETDVYRNVMRHHNDDALEPDGYCSNVRIFENTISDSHMAVSVAPTWPGPTWIVRNIAYDIGNTRTSQIDGYTSSFLKINSDYPDRVGPILMYHNTVYTTAPQTEAMYLLDPGVTSSLRSRNNVFVSTQYVWVKVNNIAVDANYDLLYTTDNTRFVKWLGTQYTSLATLRTGVAQELAGFSAPPQLASPATGNFRPLSTSPLIDHGTVLAGINDGYIGAAPDIGAIEYDDRIFADGFGQ